MRTNFQNSNMWTVRKKYKSKRAWHRPKVDEELRNNHYVNEFLKVPVTLNPIYADYIKSKEWHSKALLVKQYYRFICQKCRTKYHINNLHCHHVTYERLGAESFLDLQCLCKRCHQREHFKSE